MKYKINFIKLNCLAILLIKHSVLTMVQKLTHEKLPAKVFAIW